MALPFEVARNASQRLGYVVFFEVPPLRVAPIW
jgi:hypothetical protein